METVRELADLGYAPAIRHLSQNVEVLLHLPEGEASTVG
jgi:hypothetical protein